MNIQEVTGDLKLGRSGQSISFLFLYSFLEEGREGGVHSPHFQLVLYRAVNSSMLHSLTQTLAISLPPHHHTLPLVITRTPFLTQQLTLFLPFLSTILYHQLLLFSLPQIHHPRTNLHFSIILLTSPRCHHEITAPPLTF